MKHILIKLVFLAVFLSQITLVDSKVHDQKELEIDKNIDDFLKQKRNDREDLKKKPLKSKVKVEKKSQKPQNLIKNQNTQEKSIFKQDITDIKKLALLRELLFEEAKKGNNLQQIKISDEDLYKQIDKHIQKNRDSLLKNIQEKFNEKFKDKQFQSQEEKDRFWQQVIKGVAIGIIPFLINGLITLGIYAIGFTGAGIAAGSIATVIQAALYGGAVPAGGWFAGLQGVGAVGVGIVGLPVIIGGGAALAVGYGAYSYLSNGQL